MPAVCHNESCGGKNLGSHAHPTLHGPQCLAKTFLMVQHRLDRSCQYVKLDNAIYGLLAGGRNMESYYSSKMLGPGNHGRRHHLQL